jgi:hypothetical protein
MQKKTGAAGAEKMRRADFLGNYLAPKDPPVSLRDGNYERRGRERVGFWTERN